MFHVKHSHKRKFLRIGRILQRCGRFACAASSAVRGAASAGGRAAHLSGTPPQLAGAPLTWWRRCLTWRGRYLTWRGCYLTWRGCRLGWRGRCLGCRETAGVSRPPNGFHCGESAARCSCACSCSGVFHNPRPSHRRLCRKLPTCVVGLHRADSARRLSRSVGFALEKMANGG